MKNISSLKNSIIFEIKSLLGRRFLNKKPKLLKEKNYLNLGCGLNVIDGYINADFFKLRKPWIKDNRNLQWQLDLRYPLKCNNGTFDGIYSEHTIEHLKQNEVEKLLNELYRIMKKDATIRITVPDIEKYVNYYKSDYSELDKEEFKKRFTNPCQAIQSITQNYSHLSVWDFENLKHFLNLAGFKDVVKTSFRKGSDEKLLIDIENRKWETLYVEAKK